MASWIQAVRLYAEWAPLIDYGQKVTAAKDSHGKVVAIVEALKWLATKTDTPVDDRLVASAQAMLLTPQGEDFIRACIDEAGKIGAPK